MNDSPAAHGERLPLAVSELALRLGADPGRSFDTVSFSQSGRMRLSLKSQLWLPFTARQTMSVISCAFAWNARFAPLGFLAVTDALEEGVGRLDVTALGFMPLVRTKANAALTRGELIRYLAELPLLPDAMLHNHNLVWRQLDASTIAVSAGGGDTACEVVFSLGPNKRISSAFCADRAANTTPPFAPMPWRCVFSDYRQNLGRWIPTSAQVGWVIDGMEFVYWKGRIGRWATSVS